MKIIGMTGGVGSGKSTLIQEIAKQFHARVIFSDEAAKMLEEKGGACHAQIVSLLGKEILKPDGSLNKKAMAEKIFADDALLHAVNGILHPAVKAYIVSEIDKERKAGEYTLFIVEAALLIEERYDLICDELWYVYCDEEVRRARLKESRGYSDEKINQIFASQLSDAQFREGCQRVIDNSGELKDALQQVHRLLEES